MVNKYMIGHIYTLAQQIDLSQSPKQEVRHYKRMLALKAPFFLVVQNTANRHIICAPLYKKRIKRSVEVKISGEPYYAYCSALQRISSEYLIESHVPNTIPSKLVETILEIHSQWKQKKIKKNKKKKQKQQYEKVEISSCYQSNNTIKIKTPSTVSWNISHPLQGGRVSPK